MKTLNKLIFGILVILGITLVFAQASSTDEIVYCEKTNANKFLDNAILKIQEYHPAIGNNTCVKVEKNSNISARAINESKSNKILLTSGLLERIERMNSAKAKNAILIFILSHELGHFALKHNHSCSDPTAIENERQADIYGTFLTYASVGFDSSVIPNLNTIIPETENDACHDSIRERIRFIEEKSILINEQASLFAKTMEQVRLINNSENGKDLEELAKTIISIQKKIFSKEKVGENIPILTFAQASINHKHWLLTEPGYTGLNYMATIYFPVDLTSDTTRGVGDQKFSLEFYEARGKYKSYLEKVPNDSKVIMNYLLLLMYSDDEKKDEKVKGNPNPRFLNYYNKLKQAIEADNPKYLNNLAIIASQAEMEKDKTLIETWFKDALKLTDTMSDKKEQKEMRKAIHFNLAKFYFDPQKKSKNYEENVSAYITLSGGCNASDRTKGWLEVVGVNCAKNEKEEEADRKKREEGEVITGVGDFKLDMYEKDLKTAIKKQGLAISNEKFSGEKNRFNTIEVKKNNKLAFIFKLEDKKLYAIQVFPASEEKISGIAFGEYFEDKPDKTQKIDGKDTRHYPNRNLKVVFDKSSKVEEITIEHLR